MYLTPDEINYYSNRRPLGAELAFDPKYSVSSVFLLQCHEKNIESAYGCEGHQLAGLAITCFKLILITKFS